VIRTGDCIEVMAGMPADSVDAVVTDPPYGLEFMGKRWDAFKSPGRGARVSKERAAELTPAGKGHTTSKGPFLAAGVDQYIAGTPFQAWCEAWGREALRVTRPGGYLLAFGGTRTHHRLVCGLEDAGWIIRDELDWIYASGFPKGKANLKPAHEPIVLARKPGPLRPLAINECRIAADWETDPTRRGWQGGNSKTVGPTGNFGMTGDRIAQPNDAGRWPSNLLLSDPELFDEPNPGVVGSGATAGDFTQGKYHLPDRSATDAMFAGGRLDAGNTYTDTGGYSRFFRVPGYGTNEQGAAVDSGVEFTGPQPDSVYLPSPDYPRAFIIPKADRADREPIVRGQLADSNPFDRGGPSRNFEAMGSKSTARSNSHPTVKPTDLMRHLVRLVTPQGGTVLDCFAGSGSTLIAAEMEGFAWIGIEQDASYVAIAEARLNGTQRGLGLDVGAPTKIPPKTHPALSKHQPKRRSPSENYRGGWIGTEDEPAA